MSPSVYTTRALLPSTNQDLRIFKPKVKKVSRQLFGPVDHKATEKFIKTELRKIIVTKSEEWNFDFQTEKTLNPDGLYIWKQLTPEETAPLHQQEQEVIDISRQYFDLCERDVVMRESPSPIRCPLSTNIGEQKGQLKGLQRRITDYMKTTKRPMSSCDVSKKQSSSEWNSDVPSKVPRLEVDS